jgi:hypothetical protein
MTGITNLTPISAAAERMRRYRERKQDGRRCVTIQVLESELVALEKKGWLGPDTRNDPIEIAGALYKLFEATLT